MQTFIPDGYDLVLGFEHLDYKRLGKQRVEAWQILNVLRGVDNDGNPKNHKGWVNHPATKMWRGHTGALAYYGWLCCLEWRTRGYKDTLLPRFWAVVESIDEWDWPEWLYDPAVAETHRSNLIRKDHDHYAPIWPNTPDNLEYIWPVS